MNALGFLLDLVGQRSVVAGLPWAFEFTWKAGAARTPVDLTGCSGRWEVFDGVNSATSPLELNAALGGISGTVGLALTAPQATLVAAFERPVYRLFLTDAVGRERLFMRGALGVLEG